MALLGGFAYQRLRIDAVPDITNVQVQVNTEAPGYSPLEAEQRVSFAIETAMAGLPRLEQTRSLSRYGLSQVTVVFKEGTDIYFARQLVGERLQQARASLPAGLTPTMYIRMALLAYAPVLLTTVSGRAVAASAREVNAVATSGAAAATAAPPSSVRLRTMVGVLPVQRWGVGGEDVRAVARESALTTSARHDAPRHGRRSIVRSQSRSTTIGAWSDGPLPLRASRST